MALSKRKRGFRSITVNDQLFNWRVDAFLDIRSGIFSETSIHVGLEWVDSRIPFEERSCMNNLVVTPKLVRGAILFALKNNWDPAVKTNEVFSVRYEKELFSLVTY